MEESDICVICKNGFDDDNPSNIVRQKGLETLIRVSEEKNETELHSCLVQLKERNREFKL